MTTTRLATARGLPATAVLVLAAMLGGGEARAQTIFHEESTTYRSPQRWAIELRFGPYYPNVDSEFPEDGAEGPHRQYFGKKNRLLTQLEVDFQFFQAFGTAAAGIQVGYFTESAKSFKEGSNERSGDETSLTLFPLALTAVYRFDVLARRWRVPLVPYGKLGLSYTIWNIYDGNGNVARSDAPSGNGRGGTPGWQGAAGLALLLDFLDPGSARELDTGAGVNHTYLFFEVAHFAATGLGRKNVLRVGDTTWMAGLLFEL